MLTVIDTRSADCPSHIPSHPRLRYVLARNHWTPRGEILTPVGRHETRHEAEVAMQTIVRRPYIAAMTAALALTASTYSAKAATVNVTNQWYSITGGEAGDMSQAPPQFVQGASLQNGAPLISNGSAYFSSVSNGALEWWTPGFVSAFNGPAATAALQGNSFDVNSNGNASVTGGDFSESETITFTNAVSEVTPLTISTNAESAVIFLNGTEINATSNGVESIGELLRAGTNTIQVFAAWNGGELGGATPFMQVDPAFTSAAVTAAPEASTWVMCGIGAAFLGYAGHKRRKQQPRLASLR